MANINDADVIAPEINESGRYQDNQYGKINFRLNLNYRQDCILPCAVGNSV